MTESTAVEIGKILIDRDTGKSIRLTSSEFVIFEQLVLSQGCTVTRVALFDRLYAGIREIQQPEPKIIDVFVCKLRKKLARAIGDEHYIETVYGTGYRLSVTNQGEASS